MKLVHLSDLHLGFRAFPRVERGWNLRERDVSTAFQQAFLEVARLAPDLVLVTGDLFDRPDPPSTALLTLSRGLATFRAHAPSTPVLVIAGERDTPRTPADPGPVAVLDGFPGVEAAAGAPRAVHLRELETHALLVPHRAALRPPFPELRPYPDARFNILLLRGHPDNGEGTGEGLAVDPEEWDYVAIGGDHRYRAIHSNVRVAGSLERIGWDPWREATEEKGFVVFDASRGEGDFHPVQGRPVVDLAPVRTGADEVEEGSRRLRHLLDGTPGGIEGKIVRVRLRGDLLSPAEGVAPGLLAAIRRRAAHAEFHLTQGSEGGEWGAEIGGGLVRLGGVEVTRSASESLLLEAKGGVIGLMATDEAERDRLRRGLAGALPGAYATGRDEPSPVRLRLEGSGGGLLSRLILLGDPNPDHLLERGLGELAARCGDDSAPRASEGSDSAGLLPVEGDGSDGNGDLPGRREEEPARAEAALRERRADLAEVAGDLEARTMEWAQERQDAESHLQAYRDRARELKQRLRRLEEEGAETPCPTCGRPIGSDLPRLVETLREEWEGVVQDGRWWKMRREQLDEKPVEIREMEGATLRLQAELRVLEQQVERARVAEDGRPTAEEADLAAASLTAAERSTGDSALRRELLRHAGRSLMRLTEGRVQGLAWGAEGVELLDRMGRRWRPSEEERRLLSLVLQPALAAAARRRGEGVEGTVLAIPSVLDAEAVTLRLLDSLPQLVPSGDTLILVLSPEVAARATERFRHLVEIRTDEEGRTTARLHPSGRPRLLLSYHEGESA